MRYAAFLRAINVAGKQLSMPALKAMCTALGFEDPQTLLQSGNLIFSAQSAKAGELETLLERETKRRLKVDTEYFIRNANELNSIIDKNPFAREAREDPGRLVVVLLKDAPVAKTVTELQDRITGPEVVRASGRHLYVTYPDGQGRSKLTNAVIQKALNTHGTARNWNTILKVAGALKHPAG